MGINVSNTFNAQAQNNFLDSVVTVTGGTGSFGNTMVRHLLNSGVKEIRVFSRDENKQDNLRNLIKDSRVKFFIGDTRDLVSVENVIKGSDFVFHAAALKQVPSCEFYPLEAVKTNILGTENVLNASIANNVKKVVINDIIFPNVNQSVSNVNNNLSWQYGSSEYLISNNIDLYIIPVPNPEKRISYSSLPNSVYSYTGFSVNVNNFLVYQSNIMPGFYTISNLISNIRSATSLILHAAIK